MNVLGMFARHPIRGKTKTRLAATIGDDAATSLYAAFVEDLLCRCVDCAEEFIVAVTPESDACRAWFSERMNGKGDLRFQPDGDLGERIEWYFKLALQRPGDKVLLIGSDSPDLPTTLIDAAFRELDSRDMVVAPATDGGFVLIGLKSIPEKLFCNVQWSAATTLQDTLEAASTHGLSVKLLSVWYDVDTVEDLGALMALQQSADSQAERCPITSNVLSRIWPQLQKTLHAR